MQFPAWDPVLFDIPGLPIDIRWYGLMYVVGFVVAQWILVRLARGGFFPVKPEVAPDLVFYCVFGVMLGGRTGYALFYEPSLRNPLKFLQVWEGGLAFHGGLAGVAVAIWLFCRRHRLPWLRVADCCALVVTPGIFAVRVANFINGELFGRMTSKDTPFAMQFPTDDRAAQLLGMGPGWTMRDRELCIQVAFDKRTFADVKPLLSEVDSSGQAIDWLAVAPKLDWAKASSVTLDGAPFVPFRHPSQLYEAVGEGLFLGLLLLVLWRLTRQRPLPVGRYAVVFLCGYAAIRWGLELVRQPDAHLGTVMLGMTMGQLLSFGLVAGAIVMFVAQRRSPPPLAPPGAAGAT